MLNDATIASGSVALHRESASAPTMALRGTIFNSLLFLLVAIAFDAFGWNRAIDWFSPMDTGITARAPAAREW